MEFRVLGPVEVWVSDQTVDAGHARQRAVLAVLLLDLGRAVPADRLIDRVWGEDPPAAVRNVIYSYIARLRAMLASAADGQVTLSRRQAGYLLQADAEQLDLHRFRSLIRQATAAADESAEKLLGEALGLWHGPALAGLDSPWLNAMRDTLELERHAALLDLNDIRLRRGQHPTLAAELVSLATANPADERVIGQLILALYRSGRQADALHWYDQTRHHLADELGTDPAPQLRELHQQILRADPALTLAAPTNTGKPAQLVPRELPADVAAFTGRAAELAALDRLLLPTADSGAQPTAAVISAVAGTAGVGKTALAVHWAHRAADYFPDGQLHVNLRGYDSAQPVSAADALAGFLRSVGDPGEQIPAEEAERAARYRSLLADKRMLILLDNAATVDQVRPLLPGHPACRVLVTSRDSLAGLVARDGACRLELDLLPLDDAVALLRDLIGELAVDIDAVTELADQCARLPLALRVAAELAAARHETAITDLVAELRDEERRLDLLHVGGDPRTAVRAVLSWSYDHLDDVAASALRVAGLHPGLDFDAYALAALAGTSMEETHRAVGMLTRAHLIQATRPGRHGMHDLVRAYARELAALREREDGLRTALTRLFDYYLSTAAAAMNTAFPADRHRRPRFLVPPGIASPPLADSGAARQWLDAERANLAAIAGYAADNGWARHATLISPTLYRYLTDGGYAAEALVIHGHALRAAQLAADVAGEAEALKGLGSANRNLGRYQQSAAHQRHAIALFRKAGDRNGQAACLHNLAYIEEDVGDYALAARHNRQALALFREVGDPIGQALSLNSLGNRASQLGRYPEAARWLREALELFRETGYDTGQAGTLINLGIIDERMGRYPQADDHYQQALVLFRRSSDRGGEALALESLGNINAHLGEYDRAAERLQHSIELYRAIVDPSGEAKSRCSLGAALFAGGRAEDAEREYVNALRLASETGQKEEQARAHDGLGHCHLAHGSVDLARAHWQLALELFTEIGSPDAEHVRSRLAGL